MSLIPILGSLDVKGDVFADSTSYLTGDVRPLYPFPAFNSGTYVLDSFPVSKYRSTEYVVQVTQGSKFSRLNLAVIHDGTTASILEYGRIDTSTMDVTFDAIIQSGNVIVTYSQLATMTVVKATCLSLNF